LAEKERSGQKAIHKKERERLKGKSSDSISTGNYEGGKRGTGWVVRRTSSKLKDLPFGAKERHCQKIREPYQCYLKGGYNRKICLRRNYWTVTLEKEGVVREGFLTWKGGRMKKIAEKEKEAPRAEKLSRIAMKLGRKRGAVGVVKPCGDLKGGNRGEEKISLGGGRGAK